MRPEEQCIAIAKACGWTEYQDGEGWHKPGETQPYLDPPEYLNDLNAMHEAEKVFYPRNVDLNSPDLALVYMGHLHRICVGHPGGAERATAAQRAEAFLRTLGLWEEK